MARVVAVLVLAACILQGTTLTASSPSSGSLTGSLSEWNSRHGITLESSTLSKKMSTTYASFIRSDSQRIRDDSSLVLASRGSSSLRSFVHPTPTSIVFSRTGNVSADTKSIATEKWPTRSGDKGFLPEDYDYYGDYDAFFRRHYADAIDYLLSSSLSSEINSSDMTVTPSFTSVSPTQALVDDVAVTSSSLISDVADDTFSSSSADASTHEYFLGSNGDTSQPSLDDLADVFEWSTDDALDSPSVVTHDEEELQSHRSVRSVSTVLSHRDSASTSVVIFSSVVVRDSAHDKTVTIRPSSTKTLSPSPSVSIPLHSSSALSYLISSHSVEESEYLSPFKPTEPLSIRSQTSSVNNIIFVSATPTPSTVGFSRTPFSNRGAQNKKQNIDEIITGLMHLLGSNVHVAHTDSSADILAITSPLVSDGTRINDRGPPRDSASTTSIAATTHAFASGVVFSTASHVDSHVGVLEPSQHVSVHVKTEESKMVSDEVTLTRTISSVRSSVLKPSNQTSPSVTKTLTHKSTTSDPPLPTGPITEWVPVYLQPFEVPSTTKSSSTLLPPTRASISTPSVEPTLGRPGLALPATPPTRKSSSPRPLVPTNELRPLPSIENDFRPVGSSNSGLPLFPSQSNERVPEPVLAEDIKNVYDVTLTATGFMGGENPKPPPSTSSSSTSRSPTGKPFVVPVDIDDVNIGPGNPAERPIISAPGSPDDQSVFIDGRRTYFHLNPSVALGDKKDESTRVLGVGGNVQDPNKKNPDSSAPPFRPSPTKRPQRPSNARKPPRVRNTTPLIRIDTCIVGDETACDAEHYEVCRTEAGVSSCSCRPGFARSTSQASCIPVVALLVYVRIDRFNDERLTFQSPYADQDTPESQALEREVIVAMDSAFQMTSLAPLYAGIIFNKFYALGGKLAINITLYLQENLASKNPTIRQRVSRDLVNLLRQRQQNLGQSHLYVDPQFSPVPGVQDLNECSDPELNDCSVNARCDNNFGGFKCICLPGFTDKYPSDKVRSGRICSACTSDYCNQRGECVLKDGQQECICKGSYIGSRCEIDGEVLGVALGASLAALLIIILTLVCLCMWSRRWKRDHQKPELRPYQPPSYTFGNKPSSMLSGALPPPPVHSSLMEDRMNWGHSADSFGNYYTTEPVTHGKSVPVSATNSSLVAPSSSSKYLQSHLSRSRTSLIETDGDPPMEENSRFHVPRPKPRSIYNQQQNIYYDLDYGSSYDNYGTGNTYHGSNYSAYPLQNMRPYYS